MQRKLRTGTIHNKSHTSAAAVQRVQLAARGQGQAVLKYIREQGMFGATDSEIQAALQMKGDTERPRRRELEQAGLITEAHFTRDNCKVWLFVELPIGPNDKPATKPPAAAEPDRAREHRQRCDADRAELERLETTYGPALDWLTPAELTELVSQEPDEAHRNALAKLTERLPRTNSLLRQKLLQLLAQNETERTRNL